MATSKRIYVVTENLDNEGQRHRMVRAATGAQALRHVVEPRFMAEVATPDQCAELGGKGVKVEDAAE